MYVRYSSGGTPSWGIRRGDEIHNLAGETSDVTVRDVANRHFRAQMAEKVRAGAFERTTVEDVNLLAPTESPNKVVVVGLNFEDRVEEYDRETPEKPILYGKATSTLTNPNDPIVYPSDVAQLDYEVELAVVIGRRGRNVPVDEAEDVVAGYSVVNDVSARDAHDEDPSAFRGNSYDTFAPLGPHLVPPDQVDLDDTGISLSVNGETKQESNTGNFIFSVDELIEYISGVMTLYPGDVICTGTPGGAGIYRDPPELLEPGDIVRARVDSIGTLENEVVAESALRS